MKCDITAIKNHVALCLSMLTQMDCAAKKMFSSESSDAICGLLTEMRSENEQLLSAVAEYEKAVKKAECYVQSVRLE